MGDSKDPKTPQNMFWCNDCNKSFPSNKVDKHFSSMRHRRTIEKIRKEKGIK